MKFWWIQRPYYFGLSIGVLSLWLIIYNIRYARACQLISAILLAIFFILAVIEITTSRKAAVPLKIVWSLAMIGIPAALYVASVDRWWLFIIAIVIFSRVYMSYGRRLFIATRADRAEIEFDSF